MDALRQQWHTWGILAIQAKGPRNWRHKKLKFLCAGILLGVFAFPAFAQNQAARILGIIDSFNGQILSVKSQDGQVASITVPPNLKVTANAEVSLADRA